MDVETEASEGDASNNQSEILEVAAAPEISPAQFHSNMVKMTVMWSCSSFVSYLLVFMNKYFEGSIFTNNYIEGVAGIMASQIGGVLYARYGMKRSFIFSFGMSLCGGVLIYLLESHMIRVPASFLLTFPGPLRH